MIIKRGILLRDIKWGYSIAFELGTKDESMEKFIKAFEDFIRKHEKHDYRLSRLNLIIDDIEILKGV